MQWPRPYKGIICFQKKYLKVCKATLNWQKVEQKQRYFRKIRKMKMLSLFCLKRLSFKTELFKTETPQPEIKDFACVKQNILINQQYFLGFFQEYKCFHLIWNFFQAPVFLIGHQTRNKQSFNLSVSKSDGVVQRLTWVSVTQWWGVACNCEFPAFCPVVPFSGHCYLWLVSQLNAAARLGSFSFSY